MGKYTKHKSNYIRTNVHQYLKGGSTIFERDWVTIGSQLNFGPGKVPYYNSGNFIFTTSPIPYYQKRYKNGVTVATWTYEDVQNATSTVNEIKLDEHCEDIRNYAYYGSCTELVRSSIEHIINTFPGMITVSNEDLGVFKDVSKYSCDNEEEMKYLSLNGCYKTLNNPFDINIFLTDVQVTQYDNPLHYLTHSIDKYEISTDGGSTFKEIETYDVVLRQMYETTPAIPCIESKNIFKETISIDKGEEITVNDLNGGFYVCVDEPSDLCGQEANINVTSPFTIQYSEGGVLTVNGEDIAVSEPEDTINVNFYENKKIEHYYKSYQMLSNNEYAKYNYEISEKQYINKWVISTCRMENWLPSCVIEEKQEIFNTQSDFLNRCDDVQKRIIYSYLDNNNNECTENGISEDVTVFEEGNKPVYTITITLKSEENIDNSNEIKIEGYILNNQIIPLVDVGCNLIIKPKDEVIDEYFNNLEGFEKQLLTRKTNPHYSNRFVTPLAYDLGYLYYKRTYTWPSNGYCIDITSPKYIDFVTDLGKTAELFDELWTDNLWRRMTHEAIKNYDWTYTREFEEGDEEDNVDGGERMHKVINIIGRVFDDVKRTIDTIRKNNKVSFDSDRNIPNALLSDKLELRGWDIYSTIPSYEEEDETSVSKIFSASDLSMGTDIFQSQYMNGVRPVWYPTLDSNQITFADVDVEFMRRLLLCSRRILETKGTRQSIDMIFGMFGYGEKDYSISEEYFIVEPQDYDEVIGGTDNPEEETFGDRLVRLNMSKDGEFLYNDEASGIPVGSFTVFEKDEETHEQQPKTYLIPFYDHNKIYDGDLYFQSKGGWFYNETQKESDSEEETNVSDSDNTQSGTSGGAIGNAPNIPGGTIQDQNTGEGEGPQSEDEEQDPNIKEINPYKFTETLSYLHVVSLVRDLLNVHPNSVRVGDIYYVANLNDYKEFTDEDPYSNFFVLMNEYLPENFDSWENLDLTLEREFTEDETYIKQYVEYVNKAKYLDSIIPYNIGNNPHVGYGRYDLGNEYYEYMKQPFKYSIDTNNFSDIEDKNQAKEITFEIDRKVVSNYEYDERNRPTDIEKGDKVIVFAKNCEEEGVEEIEVNIVNKTFDPAEETKPEWGLLKYGEYKLDEIKKLQAKKYYLNSKVIYITLENKELKQNKCFKNYFSDVILKYLMQVIPSTTIVVLVNFEITGEEKEITPQPPTEKVTVNFYDCMGNELLHQERVIKGDTVANPEQGADWYVSGNSLMSNFDFNLPIDDNILNGKDYLNLIKKVEYTVTYYRDISNGRPKTVFCNTYYPNSEAERVPCFIKLREDSYQLTQLPILVDKNMVLYHASNVRFVLSNGNVLLDGYVRTGDVCEKPPYPQYEWKKRGTQTKITNWPVRIIHDTEVFYQYNASYTVTWVYDDEE